LQRFAAALLLPLLALLPLPPLLLRHARPGWYAAAAAQLREMRALNTLMHSTVLRRMCMCRATRLMALRATASGK
jgi:hypothetical protein